MFNYSTLGTTALNELRAEGSAPVIPVLYTATTEISFLYDFDPIKIGYTLLSYYYVLNGAEVLHPVYREDVIPYDILKPIPVTSTTSFPYSDTIHITATCTSKYGDKDDISSTLLSKYASLKYLEASITSSYSDTTIVNNTLLSSYSSSTVISNTLLSNYSQLATTKITNTLSSSYIGSTVILNTLLSNYIGSTIVSNTLLSNYSESPTVKVSNTLSSSYIGSTVITNTLLSGYIGSTVIANTLVSNYAELPTLKITNTLSSSYIGSTVITNTLLSGYVGSTVITNIVSASYSNSITTPVTNILVSSYIGSTVISNTLLSNYVGSTVISNTLVSGYVGVINTPVTSTLDSSYTSSTVISTVLDSVYSDTVSIELVTVFPYQSLSTVEAVTNFIWGIKQSIENTIFVNYDIATVDTIGTVLYSKYSIEGVSVVSIEANPKVYNAFNNEIDFLNISLSCDEKSPYFIADIRLANMKDFISLTVKDTVRVEFNNEVYNFIIDSRNQTRSEEGDTNYTISLISPAALLDNPFAPTIDKVYTVPTMASVVVEDMLGSVAWNLPDWMVPVEQLQFVNSTKMHIAKKIVSAVGGLIESAPDGSIICRATYPKDTNKYKESVLDAAFYDFDILSTSEAIAPQTTFNRVDIYNTSLATAGVKDTTEYVKDDKTNKSNRSGVIFGYPSPYRPVHLVHTGDPSTVIKEIGDFERVQTEQIEFLYGKATTKYPIHSIVSMQWNMVNLGSVSYSGKQLTSTVQAESLLKISYIVKSKKWEVSSMVNDEVQFCLLDDS